MSPQAEVLVENNLRAYLGFPQNTHTSSIRL
jgi:hypothetical protein